MVVFELEAIASMTGVCPLGDSSSEPLTSCVYLRACRLNTDPASKVPKRAAECFQIWSSECATSRVMFASC